MDVQTLHREPAVVPEGLEDLEMGIVNAAAAELGYNRGRSVLQAAQHTINGVKILRNLDIQPFRIADVERYKAAMTRRELFRVFLPMFIGLVPMALWGIYGAMAGFPTAPSIGATTTWAVAIVCVIGIAWTVRRGETRNRWQESTLANYSSAIPAFALDRALTIERQAKLTKNAWPIFAVEYFAARERSFDSTLDPFLIVRFGEEAFYIDVWDEPNFKGTRIV